MYPCKKLLRIYEILNHIFCVSDISFPGDSSKLGHNAAKIRFTRNENITLKTTALDIDGTSINVVSVGEKHKASILFLHGMAFSAKTWVDLNTLVVLGKFNYHVLAIDLPGYGNSEQLKVEMAPEDFLKKIIETLDLSKPIIISPSMSGKYSIPYVIKYSSKVSGFVPIAPVIDPKYSSQIFEQLNVPTLVIYGENDKSAQSKNKLLSRIQNSKVEMIPNGSHPCYLDNPKLFHLLVKNFVDSLN